MRGPLRDLLRPMGRRDFVRGLLAVLGLAALGPAAATAGEAGPRRGSRPVGGTGLARDLARLFSHPYSAAEVGREYLRRFPHEADPERLVDLVCGSDPRRRRALLDATPAARRELLSAWLRRDFAEGRTVEVEGWVLSATEARLCALAALL